MRNSEEIIVRRVNGFGSNPIRFEGSKEDVGKAFYLGMSEATIEGNASVMCSSQAKYGYTAPMDIMDRLFSSLLSKKI